MDTTEVVGSADPPEFSTPVAQALGYMGYLWVNWSDVATPRELILTRYG
jgi:hypothetical protein